MRETAPQLPTDIEALHALLAAAHAERDAAIAERDQARLQNDRLRHLLRQLQRAQFGRRSEKLDPAIVGAQLVGPLPGELASMTMFTAAIDAHSASPQAAKALIEFLAGPQAAPQFKAKGFEPG